MDRKEYLKRVQAVDCVIDAVGMRNGDDRFAAYGEDGLVATKDTYKELTEYLTSKGLTYIDAIHNL